MRVSEANLIELCVNGKSDIVDGPFGSNLKSEHFISEGIPTLKIQNIKEFNILKTNLSYVSPSKFKELSRHSFKSGDIVLTKLGAPLGAAAIVDDLEEGLIVADLVRIRINQEIIDTKFLCYLLNSPSIKIQINSQSKGATRPRIKLSVIRDLRITYPPLSEQKRIVAKLDATFAEIDRIKRINQIRIANSVLFNQKYLSSIEAKKKQIGDLADIKTGKLNANAMTDDGEYPFFTCSKEIFKINNYAFDCEAVLLAGNNASGDFNVKHYIGKFNAYQRTYVITVKEKVLLRSRYLYFQLINSLNNFKKMSVGTGTRFLKLGMIKEFAIPLPSLEEQDQILRHLEIINEETKHIKKIYNDIGTNLLSLNSAILSEELQKKSYE